ncbi:MFS transporter [Halarchaeum sp. P4]|uniref:MFS transporter n=1 Tax=Halarchaeum sp. P4 TaxID=3421639 RepID=UPI003EBCA498
MSAIQGIRENWQQFVLQLLMVFAVGLTIGSERTVVPVLGREVFGLESLLVIGSFVLSFGFVKALLNLYGGKWADTYGRKPILSLGWVVALPIPVVLVFATNWWWVTLANVLLGVNQGLAWSMSVNAKIDLAGDTQRGLAVGLDETFGYVGVAVGGWISGVVATAYGLRPEPFFLLAGVVLVGLLASILLVEETKPYADAEADAAESGDSDGDLPFAEVVKQATYGDRTLFAAAQAGSVEKFVDALVWIAFPLYFTTRGLSVAEVGVVVGVYGGVWGVGQLYTGRLADRIGRRPPIVVGMFIAGVGTALTAVVSGYWLWIGAATVTGAGMALLYPNLITVVGDAAHPRWRAQGLGVYRMWRDAGYGFGAIFVGLLADLVSIEAAILGVGVAMLLSGLVTLAWLEETHPNFGTHGTR